MAEKSRSLSKSWIKTAGIATAVGLVFLAGFAIGNGTISFSGSQSSQTSQLPSNLSYTSVEQVYDLLRKNYDGKLEESKLIEGMKRGMVQAAGDPYTEFLSVEQTKEFDDDLNGTFTGIGAQLGKDEQGNVIIVSPIDGFPAKKAGLQPRDVVVQVNDEETSGWTVDQAVDKIRGPAGSTVKLKLVRNGELVEVSIVREEITIPSVEYKVLDGNIGYIKISQFGDDTTALAQAAAKELKAKNVNGVILDVRGNPGGLLESSVDVSSLWLKSGQTVLEEKRDGQVIKKYTARGESPLQGVETIVLIDGGSASASEITAGALRDNNAAQLLGQKSFGKGSVQSIQRLADGSALKVTIARWFTPNGKNIDKEGIEPDQKVEASTDPVNDTQLNAAIEALKK